MTEQTDHEAAVERAAKRVKELRDFYVHLAIYLVVNTGLVIIDLVQGDGLQWAQWVILGWGIGLVAHAVSVFVFESRSASRWEARKLAEYTKEEERGLRGT
jgi:2TM domain